MKSSNGTLNIDGIDKKILRFLMADARKPILEIARNIGISWSCHSPKVAQAGKIRINLPDLNLLSILKY